MAAPTPLDVLARARYMLLSTTKLDGSIVPTPVWVVRDGSRLYVWTDASSGKAKRIQHTPQVSVAPCSLRGTPRGASVPGSARVHDDYDTIRHVQQLLVAKYGLQAKLSLLRSRGSTGPHVAIEITLPPEPAAAPASQADATAPVGDSQDSAPPAPAGDSQDSAQPAPAGDSQDSAPPAPVTT